MRAKQGLKGEGCIRLRPATQLVIIRCEASVD